MVAPSGQGASGQVTGAATSVPSGNALGLTSVLRPSSPIPNPNTATVTATASTNIGPLPNPAPIHSPAPLHPPGLPIPVSRQGTAGAAGYFPGAAAAAAAAAAPTPPMPGPSTQPSWGLPPGAGASWGANRASLTPGAFPVLPLSTGVPHAIGLRLNNNPQAIPRAYNPTSAPKGPFPGPTGPRPKAKKAIVDDWPTHPQKYIILPHPDLVHYGKQEVFATAEVGLMKAFCIHRSWSAEQVQGALRGAFGHLIDFDAYTFE